MPIQVAVPVVVCGVALIALAAWGCYELCSWLSQSTSIEEFEALTCLDTFTLHNAERGVADTDSLFDRVAAQGESVTCIYESRFRDGCHTETVEVVALKSLARLKIVFEDGKPLKFGAKLGPLLPFTEKVWYACRERDIQSLAHIFQIVQNEARYEIPIVTHCA